MDFSFDLVLIYTFRRPVSPNQLRTPRCQWMRENHAALLHRWSKKIERRRDMGSRW